MNLKTLEKQGLINKINSLEKEVEELKEYNCNKKIWLALLSHDFKGVFANLIWLLSTYKSKSISSEMLLDLLPELELDARKNLKAIDDTFLAARIQYDNSITEKQNLNLKVVFDEVNSLLSDAIIKKDLTLNFICNEHINIQNNNLIVKSVLIKIIENAIKYSHQGGKIVCTLTITENCRTLITIEDFGTGIDDYTLNKIFSLNKSSYNGTSGEKGVGLGLVLVKEALRLINGTIDIKSTTGIGTQVNIVL